MLKRLGAVAWWLGALSAGLALLIAIIQLQAQVNCPAAIDKSAAVERQRESASANYKLAHPSADQYEVALMASAPSLSDDERKKVDACQRGLDFAGVGFLAVLTVCMWAVAFVLAGRFWLPPVRAE